MLKKLLAGAIALSLSACASGPGGQARFLKPVANPSAVIAAELAFAQLAQTKGQWTAFRETATKDAIMFAPGPVSVRDHLKGKADPPLGSLKWQPHEVWSSCDGSLAVSRGAWQRADASVGEFLTIWQRQRDGDYQWIADLGRTRAEPWPAPEFIRASVADCTPPVPPQSRVSEVPTTLSGQSADGTLRYRIAQPDGGQVVKVGLWKDGAFSEAVSQTFEN